MKLKSFFSGRNFENDEVLSKAIKVADELDIKHCIETIITPMETEDDDFMISQTQKGRRKVLQIKVPGVADVEYSTDKIKFYDALSEYKFSAKKESKIKKIIF